MTTPKDIIIKRSYSSSPPPPSEYIMPDSPKRKRENSMFRVIYPPVRMPVKTETQKIAIVESPQPSTQQPLSTTDFQNQVLNKITQLQDTNDKIVKLLNHLSQDVLLIKRELKELKGGEAPVESLLPATPFETSEDFLEFDHILKQQSMFNVVVDDLVLIQAKDTKEFVSKSWRAVLRNSAAKHFSWQGTAEKGAVSELSTTAAIRAAYQFKYPDEPIDVFVKRTKIFFLYANDRETKSKNYYRLKSLKNE